ncbi:hypothetical protein D9M71_803640 [compost metagenome]
MISMRGFFWPPSTIASKKQPITMSRPRLTGFWMTLPNFSPSQLPSAQADHSARPPPNKRPMPVLPLLNACIDIAQLASETTTITP